MSRTVLAFFLLTICFGCQNPFDPDRPTLRGQVISDSSVGLAGVSVYTSPPSETVVTNQSGYFTIKDISPGDYTVYFTDGTSEINKEIHVSSARGLTCYEDEDQVMETVNMAASDTLPPQISYHSPKQHEVILTHTDFEISVVFSESLLSSSITNETFKLYDSTNSVDVDCQYPGTRTVGQTFIATLKPLSILDSTTVYQVTLSTGIKDLAGNNLSNEESWSFETR